MQSCPDCGAAVRYIAASHTVTRKGGDGVFTVEAQPITIIGERGRPLTGYRIHKCGESNGGNEAETGSEKEKDVGG